MKTPPVHAPMDQFPIVNGELTIGGKPITQVAREVGQTPFYAYDNQLITDRIALLRQ